MSLTRSTPVLRVADYAIAKPFYQSLGFDVTEEGGDPARFGIFRRDNAILFVDAWHGADAAPSPGWRAYVHTNDIAVDVARLKQAGVAFEGPVDAVYGMRELVVTDPDGNRICFGMDIP